MSDFETPGLSAQVSQTQADINGSVPGADSRLRRSVLGYLGKAWSGLVYGLYRYAAKVADELFVDTAKRLLARHGAIWGIPQKAATFATGPATLTGLNLAFVPAGTVLQRADQFRYQTTADVTFAGTTATAQLLALTPGAGGNAIEDTQLSFVSPVVNVNSAALVAADGLVGGNDIEDPEAWRGRILDRIRNPPQGGSRSDYVRWTLEVPGMTRAWVYPGWSGPGTVGVTFVCDDRDDIIPTSDDVAAVVAHITPLMPATAVLVAFAPIGDAQDMTILLTPNTDPVKAAVTAELRDLFRRAVIPGGTLALNTINEAISLADGETDHTLTTPVAPIVSAPGHIATLGTLSWA